MERCIWCSLDLYNLLSTQPAGEEIDETTGWPALQVPSGGGADGGPRRSWWRAAATLVEAAAALEEGRGGAGSWNGATTAMDDERRGAGDEDVGNCSDPGCMRLI